MSLHFAPINGTTGFHLHSPPILAVGKGEQVIIGVRGCGDGLHVHSERTGIAAASVSGATLPHLTLPSQPHTDVLIEWRAPGITTVTARHNGHTAHLHVHVLRHRVIYVNFYSVIDAAGKKSRRSLSTAQDIVDSMTM